MKNVSIPTLSRPVRVCLTVLTQELVQVFSEDASDFVGDIYKKRDDKVGELERELLIGDLTDEQVAQKQQEIDRLNASLPPKELAHAINGGITAVLGGNNFLSGAASGAVAEIAGNIIVDLQESGQLPGGNLLANALISGAGALTSVATGGGAVSGSIISGNIDQFNRQLHPEEIDYIRESADDFIAYLEANDDNYSCSGNAAECRKDAISRLAQQAAKSLDFVHLVTLGVVRITS